MQKKMFCLFNISKVSPFIELNRKTKYFFPAMFRSKDIVVPSFYKNQLSIYRTVSPRSDRTMNYLKK